MSMMEMVRCFSQQTLISSTNMCFITTVQLLNDSRLQYPSPRSQEQPARVLEETPAGKNKKKKCKQSGRNSSCFMAYTLLVWFSLLFLSFLTGATGSRLH